LSVVFMSRTPEKAQQGLSRDRRAPAAGVCKVDPSMWGRARLVGGCRSYGAASAAGRVLTEPPTVTIEHTTGRADDVRQRTPCSCHQLHPPESQHADSVAGIDLLSSDSAAPTVTRQHGRALCLLSHVFPLYAASLISITRLRVPCAGKPTIVSRWRWQS
jgi:hypothetical protein